MRRIKFGLFSPQIGASFSRIRERVLLADRLGFDSVWFADHLWHTEMPALDFLDAWTLASATAALTEQIRIPARSLTRQFWSVAPANGDSCVSWRNMQTSGTAR